MAGQKITSYTVFNTKWGHFGLAANQKGICRTCLPLADDRLLEKKLLENLSNPKYDKWLFNPIQQLIIAYFSGIYVNFDRSIPLVTDGFSDFAGVVLDACRDIKFGQTISYKKLAQKAGQPKSARAIGKIMACNTLPLLIPCHRVIKSDGKTGGFSAAEGADVKKKMLELEQKTIKNRTF